MRIISLNFNGIRSATTKGALAWLGQQHADVICVQELKAQEADLSDEHLAVVHNDRRLTGHFYAAQKKGYSGVGLYSGLTPTRVVRGIGIAEFDLEGRVLRADFDGAQTPCPWCRSTCRPALHRLSDRPLNSDSWMHSSRS